MSNQQYKIKLPKPKSIQDAIDMDSKLSYDAIPVELYRDIVADRIETVTFMGMHLDKRIIQQIKGYRMQTHGTRTPQIISYEGEPIKAVSSLFKEIPLGKIWNATERVLGQPKSEKMVSSGIVAQFEPVGTHYSRSGQRQEAEYDVTPTVVFGYNFAERSFGLGYCVGIMTCQNQLFFFCAEYRTKIVHNIFHMEKQGFSKNQEQKVAETIERFKDNWQTVEKVIEDSKTKPVQPYDVPVLYWKAGGGYATYLRDMYDQHRVKDEEGHLKLDDNGKVIFKQPQSYWDICMNVTAVSSHQVGSFNQAFDMSSRSANFLCKKHHLNGYDYVLSLGSYMRAKAISSDDFWEEVNLEDLKTHVRGLIPPRPEISEDAQHVQEILPPPPKQDEEQEPKPTKENRVNIPIRDATIQRRNINDYFYS